jgi:hypothetical protein
VPVFLCLVLLLFCHFQRRHHSAYVPHCPVAVTSNLQPLPHLNFHDRILDVEQGCLLLIPLYIFTVVSNQQCDWTEFVLGREIPPYHIGKHEITNVISTAVFTKCDNCFRLNKKEARKSGVIELRMGFGITHFKR